MTNPDPWALAVEACEKAADKAIRDHCDRHGPSGGPWNISQVLDVVLPAIRAIPRPSLDGGVAREKQLDTYEAGQYLFNTLRAFLAMAGIDASNCKLVIEIPDRDQQRQLVETLQRHARGPERSAARIGNHSGYWQGVEYEFSVKGWAALTQTSPPDDGKV